MLNSTPNGKGYIRLETPERGTLRETPADDIEISFDPVARVEPDADESSFCATRVRQRAKIFLACCCALGAFATTWAIRGRGRRGCLPAQAEFELSTNQVYRAYDPWDGPFPCYPFKKKKYDEGIFFSKVPKTASSTLSGVGLRIAHRKGRQLLNITSQHHSHHSQVCNVEVKHGNVRDELHYGLRNLTKSFLWSFVRDPTLHFLSHFFYTFISRSGHKLKEKTFVKWAMKYPGNFQLDYLRLHDYDTPYETLRGVVDEYDFIGLTERFDESLVVLQMLLGLDAGDVLYLSAKKSGGYALETNEKNPRCVKTEQKYMMPFMRDFFESDEWKRHIDEDMKLYQAANRSLDLTIDRLGRGQFESNLQSFREALSLAQDRCEEFTTFPCSSDGELHTENDCYKLDMGCGHQCLDEVALEL